jgi:penicillin-binding protein 1A
VAGRSGRQEPRFESNSGDGELRLNADDRPLRGRPRRAGKGDEPSRATAGRSPRRRGAQRRGLFGTLFYWGTICAVWGLVALAGLIGYFALKLPPIDQLAIPKRPPNVAILASDGSLLANRGETGGSAVPFGELPPHLPRAFVAIEDRRFYEHFGIDLVGLARAMARNLTAGRMEQGGSTLTQQLAKNIFLTQERTLARKIQEALLSLWLERTYSKDQILELYMNRVYFGSGAYGVEAAAQKFFGKSARAVTLGEAAVLAGLVQSPSRLAPNRNPKGAAERGKLVLAKMVEHGFAKPEAAKLANLNTEGAKSRAKPRSGNYVADWVMDILDDHIGVVDKDIVVKTTIDPALQAVAEKIVATEFDSKRAKLNVEQVAMIALSPDGAVRAMVGGRDYAQSQFNRAVAAKRQPGSAFKPFVYLAALERGLMPETVREDAPLSIKGWKPENYSREYFGNVTLTQALAMSLNTVAVRVGMEVGPRQVAKTAQRLGIHSALRADASIALGTSEVSPMELASAYVPFANGGTGVVTHAILEVRETSGKLIYKREPRDLGQVADPNAIAALNRMMRETLVNGTAKRADIPAISPAGKTGTTQDHKDAWFVGYSSQLVTAIWVGNDEGEPMKKVTGSGLPAELWTSFMRAAHKDQRPPLLPGLNPPGLGDAIAGFFSGHTGSVPPSAPGSQPAPAQKPPAPQGPSAEERSLLMRLFGL